MGTSRLSLQSNVRLSLARAEQELRQRGIRIIITSTFRSKKEQEKLYRQFRAGLSDFPVAFPGESTHQLGIAVDLVPERVVDLPVVVEVMRAVGFKWAGPQDRVHFTFQGPLRPSQASFLPSLRTGAHVSPRISSLVPQKTIKIRTTALPCPPCCA